MKSVGLHDPYEEFTQQNPELARRIQLIVDKGRSHLENGMILEARKEFHRALALYPYVPAALNNLALMAFGEGDSDRAKAYLKQLLQFHDSEPTANALMARYWAESGSTPLAVAHVERAAHSALSLMEQPHEGDPSRAVRSLEFVFQSLAILSDDGLLAHVFRAGGEPALMPTTLLHVGIAFFNRGDFPTAKRLWESAWQQQPDLEPARIYLTMMDLLERHHLLPFHLDHRLEMPKAEKGRRILLVHVPTLFVARALEQLYLGTGQEAEEAMALLASVSIPSLDSVLHHVGTDAAKPTGVRLVAGLQLAALGYSEKAGDISDAIEAESVHTDEYARWCLLQGVIAEARGNKTDAARHAAAGLAALKGENEAAMAPLHNMLDELLQRSAKDEEPLPPSEEAAAETPPAAFRLPDATWSLLGRSQPLTKVLEELLAKRPLREVEELAKRLGEQSMQTQPKAAFIRRLAMRMRSVQMDKIVSSLSVPGKAALQWLDTRDQETTIQQYHAWLQENFEDVDPWAVMEELFHACLIDIGSARPGDQEDLDLLVGVPMDFRGRFQSI